jgi:hypothetical protein
MMGRKRLLWLGATLLVAFSLVLFLSRPGPVAAVELDGMVAVADSGTPADDLLPSANVGQPIIISGSGFDLNTQVTFPPSPASTAPSAL